VAFSPDGQFVASGDERGHVNLWQTTPGAPMKPPLGAHGDYVVGLAFSADGKTLMSAGHDNKISLWEVATGKEIKTLTVSSGKVRSAALSNDAKLVAVGNEDKSVTVFDVEGGTSFTLQGHEESVRSVAFSPDGKNLASGGIDKIIFIWDLAERKPNVRLTGYTLSINNLMYSEDSRLLISGSEDGTVIVWDTKSNEQIYQLSGQTSSSGQARKDAYRRRVFGRFLAIRGLALSPDGQTLAAIRGSDVIYLWNINPESWVQRACGIANRPLNNDEWQKFVKDTKYEPACPGLVAR